MNTILKLTRWLTATTASYVLISLAGIITYLVVQKTVLSIDHVLLEFTNTNLPGMSIALMMLALTFAIMSMRIANMCTENIGKNGDIASFLSITIAIIAAIVTDMFLLC